MSILERKAAKEAWNKVQEACLNHANMSDNLNDIKLYLDVNKSNLPHKSEVPVEELFVMMESCISSYDKIEDDLKEANEWLNAIIKHK